MSCVTVRGRAFHVRKTLMEKLRSAYYMFRKQLAVVEGTAYRME